MSFLINSNKVMKINEENETLKSVFNDYLKYMMNFDCFSVNTANHGKGFIEVSTHLDEEIHGGDYNSELEKKLFEEFDLSSDGSYIVEMETGDSGSSVNFGGSVKLEKVNMNDISDETSWYTNQNIKLKLSGSKVDAENVVGEELAEELLFDTDAVDEYEGNGIKTAVYHVSDKWREFDKITVSEFAELLEQANEQAKAIGTSISIVKDDTNTLITDDCTSYLELKNNDYGKLGFDVYKITELKEE